MFQYVFFFKYILFQSTTEPLLRHFLILQKETQIKVFAQHHEYCKKGSVLHIKTLCKVYTQAIRTQNGHLQQLACRKWIPFENIALYFYNWTNNLYFSCFCLLNMCKIDETQSHLNTLWSHVTLKMSHNVNLHLDVSHDVLMVQIPSFR